MDFQVQYRGYNNGFPVAKTNKSKKCPQNSSSYVQNTYGQNYYPKSNGSVPKGNYSSKNYKQQATQSNYNQYPVNNYPAWNVFNGRGPINKGKLNQGFGKFEDQQYTNGYAKNFSLNYKSDKSSRSTEVSDNDNGNSDIFSELCGFRIVQNGKTIYDETNEELDSYFSGDSDSEETQKAKFASSELTIGPIANQISIPTFAE